MPRSTLDELVPKLKAIAQARGGTDERIYVRGDRKVDYGTVMKVMGRLSAAGFHRVALVTEVEQGSKAHNADRRRRQRSRPGSTWRCCCGRLSFSARPFKVDAGESLPVDLVSEKDFSAADQASRTRPSRSRSPSPLVEKMRRAQAGRGSQAEDHQEEGDLKADRPQEASGRAAGRPEPKPEPIAEKLEAARRTRSSKPRPRPTPLPPQPPAAAAAQRAQVRRRQDRRPARQARRRSAHDATGSGPTPRHARHRARATPRTCRSPSSTPCGRV